MAARHHLTAFWPCYNQLSTFRMHSNCADISALSVPIKTRQVCLRSGDIHPMQGRPYRLRLPDTNSSPVHMYVAMKSPAAAKQKTTRHWQHDSCAGMKSTLHPAVLRRSLRNVYTIMLSACKQCMHMSHDSRRCGRHFVAWLILAIWNRGQRDGSARWTSLYTPPRTHHTMFRFLALLLPAP